MEMETEMENKACGPLLAAALLLSVPLGAWAQPRQSDQIQQDSGNALLSQPGDSSAQKPAARPLSPTGSESAYGHDAFSTTITGARVELGPGDQIEVSVFDTPELTQRVRVDSEGKITLALIGELTARGMSPDGLGKLITRKLVEGRFMKSPQVSVFVLEYAGQMAYITGEVTRPGAYSLLRSHRLLDLISVAGGLTPRAGNTVTVVRKDAPDQRLVVELDDKDETRGNPEILPGDSITVAQTGIVYVLGDVQRPGGFLMDRRTTLSVVQAVALAQGVKSSAALPKALLIRTVEGNRQQIPINLKAILKSQSPDLLLAAGDIIYVPGSVTRGMGRTSLDIIESSVGLAAVYAVRP